MATIQDAWQDYERLGVGTQDWPNWARLFTADAKYWERGYDFHFDSGAQIGAWIVPEMEKHQFISLHLDWKILDGDRACIYLWNNLPAPASDGTAGRYYGFPNSSFLTFDQAAADAGASAVWSAEWDHYSAFDAAETFGRWLKAGGHPKGAVADWSLTGIAGWQPPLSQTEHSRDEVDSAVSAWTAGAGALWHGDATGWLASFTPDALVRDHGLGAARGMRTPHEWWSETGGRVGVPAEVSGLEVKSPWWVVDGNRVGVFTCVTGPNGETDMCTVLHYAGQGRFDYAEDVYNPKRVGEILAP